METQDQDQQHIKKVNGWSVIISVDHIDREHLATVFFFSLRMRGRPG